MPKGYLPVKAVRLLIFAAFLAGIAPGALIGIFIDF